MTLTGRQARFAKEYANCLNGTQAAIAAGYSPRTARAIASENLRKPSIQAEIANQERLRETRLNAEREIVQRELMKVLEADISKIFDKHGVLLPMAQWPKGVWTAIDSVNYGPAHRGDGRWRGSIKLQDRFKVLKLLAEVTGAINHRRNAKKQRSGR
jgi:phage terminase small subunit